jgi:hypothetical protein
MWVDLCNKTRLCALVGLLLVYGLHTVCKETIVEDSNILAHGGLQIGLAGPCSSSSAPLC